MNCRGKPEDIGWATVFLASNGSEFVTKRISISLAEPLSPGAADPKSLMVNGCSSHVESTSASLSMSLRFALAICSIASTNKWSRFNANRKLRNIRWRPRTGILRTWSHHFHCQRRQTAPLRGKKSICRTSIALGARSKVTHREQAEPFARMNRYGRSIRRQEPVASPSR